MIAYPRLLIWIDFSKINARISKNSQIKQKIMQNIEMFNGTPLEAVINFKGEFLSPKETKKKLRMEKEIGDMTDLMKTLLTLSYQASEQVYVCMEKIINVRFDELPDEEAKDLYTDVLNKKATKEQKKEIKKFQALSGYFNDSLWQLIKYSYPNPGGNSIRLRPDYKIVAGVNVDEVFKFQFSDTGFGVPGFGISILSINLTGKKSE